MLWFILQIILIASKIEFQRQIISVRRRFVDKLARGSYQSADVLQLPHLGERVELPAVCSAPELLPQSGEDKVAHVHGVTD